MSAPLVSVIIPTFNRASTLPEAVASVLGQAVRDLEVIVVDDGSTDETAQVLRRFQAEPRFKFVVQANRGRSVARNRGVAAAQGQYVGFLDSDDRYLPDCLEHHLKVFETDPNLGMTIGGYDYIDSGGQLLGVRRPWLEGSELTQQGWLSNCYAMPGSILLKKLWFERAGGFDPVCEIAEDWGLCLQLALGGCPMTWVRRSVCEYRQHVGGSVNQFALHRDGALQSLNKFFSSLNVPAELRPLENKARAWVHVVYARQGYSHGQGALAANDLDTAIELDPDLVQQQRKHLLEFMMTPVIGAGRITQDVEDVLKRHPPRRLLVSLGEWRQARAQVAMAAFFRSLQLQRQEEAAAALRRALALDPTWLVNRGVLSFCIKYALRVS